MGLSRLSDSGRIQESVCNPGYQTLQNSLQAELEEKRKDIQSLHVRIARQDSDIRQLSSQYRSAQQNYERQVCSVAAQFSALGLQSSAP